MPFVPPDWTVPEKVWVAMGGVRKGEKEEDQASRRINDARMIADCSLDQQQLSTNRYNR
jgi:hypothetical protein